MSASDVKPYIRPVQLPTADCVAEICAYEDGVLVATSISAQSATRISRILLDGIGWTFRGAPQAGDQEVQS